MIQQFIMNLIQLYCNGEVEDLMLFNRDRSISIKKMESPDQFFWYITTQGYNQLAIKSAYKLRYEKIIYLDEIRNIRCNAFSIKIDYVPKFNGVTYIQRPTHKLQLA